MDPLAQASSAVSNRRGDNWEPGTVADWQKEAESVQLDKEVLREIYVGALQEGRYDSAPLQGVHALEDKAMASLDPRWVDRFMCDPITSGNHCLFPAHRESEPS